MGSENLRERQRHKQTTTDKQHNAVKQTYIQRYTTDMSAKKMKTTKKHIITDIYEYQVLF